MSDTSKRAQPGLAIESLPKLQPVIGRALVDTEHLAVLRSCLTSVAPFVRSSETETVVRGPKTYERLIIYRVSEYLGLKGQGGPRGSPDITLRKPEGYEAIQSVILERLTGLEGIVESAAASLAMQEEALEKARNGQLGAPSIQERPAAAPLPTPPPPPGLSSPSPSPSSQLSPLSQPNLPATHPPPGAQKPGRNRRRGGMGDGSGNASAATAAPGGFSVGPGSDRGGGGASGGTSFPRSQPATDSGRAPFGGREGARGGGSGSGGCPDLISDSGFHSSEAFGSGAGFGLISQGNQGGVLGHALWDGGGGGPGGGGGNSGPLRPVRSTSPGGKRGMQAPAQLPPPPPYPRPPEPSFQDLLLSAALARIHPNDYYPHQSPDPAHQTLGSFGPLFASQAGPQQHPQPQYSYFGQAPPSSSFMPMHGPHAQPLSQPLGFPWQPLSQPQSIHPGPHIGYGHAGYPIYPQAPNYEAWLSEAAALFNLNAAAAAAAAAAPQPRHHAEAPGPAVPGEFGGRSLGQSPDLNPAADPSTQVPGKGFPFGGLGG